MNMPTTEEVKAFYRERQKSPKISSRKIFILNQMSKLIKPNMSVLDVGCGDGINVAGMSCYTKKIAGCDLDVTNVKRNIPAIQTFPLDITKDRIKPCATADIVTLFDVLEHIPGNTENFVLESLVEATNKYLVINTPLGLDDDQILERQVNVPKVVAFLNGHLDLYYAERYEQYLFMVWRVR